MIKSLFIVSMTTQFTTLIVVLVGMVTIPLTMFLITVKVLAILGAVNLAIVVGVLITYLIKMYKEERS